MKKYSILLLFTIGLFLLACQVDTETPLLDSADSIVNIDNNNETTLNITEPGDNPEGGPPSAEAITLHKRMAWAAYTTSAVLSNSSNAEVRPYFTDAITAGTDEFSLNNLLGTSPSDGGLFKTKFEITVAEILCGLADISAGCPNPDTSTNTPPPPVIDGPEFNQSDIPMLVAQFISYLTVENCLDLYFPFGLSMNLGNTVVTSVAHPLNENTGNFGIKRTGTYNTTHVFVDPNYIGNVVVVRPFGITSPQCDYSSYGINFDDFLD